MTYYQGAVCKGSYQLGSACGQCERCADERSKMPGNHHPIKPAPRYGWLCIKCNNSNSPDIPICYHCHNLSALQKKS